MKTTASSIVSNDLRYREDTKTTITVSNPSSTGLMYKDTTTTIPGGQMHYDDYYMKQGLNIMYGTSKPAPTITKVIFNDPATIVIWSDGIKTVVKCGEGDTFDPEKGLAMAISKRFFGNKGNYCNIFKKWVPDQPKQPDTFEEGNKVLREKIVEAIDEAIQKMTTKPSDVYLDADDDEDDDDRW